MRKHLSRDDLGSYWKYIIDNTYSEIWLLNAFEHWLEDPKAAELYYYASEHLCERMSATTAEYMLTAEYISKDEIGFLREVGIWKPTMRTPVYYRGTNAGSTLPIFLCYIPELQKVAVEMEGNWGLFSCPPDPEEAERMRKIRKDEEKYSS